ncbi:hypothetical protein T265_13912, partial [Opisthorchis viverrini]
MLGGPALTLIVQSHKLVANLSKSLTACFLTVLPKFTFSCKVTTRQDTRWTSMVMHCQVFRSVARSELGSLADKYTMVSGCPVSNEVQLNHYTASDRVFTSVLTMSARLVMKRLQSKCQAWRTDQQSISSPELPIFHNIANSPVYMATPQKL